MVFLSRKFSMIDPKGDYKMTDMQNEHVDVLQERLNRANVEMQKLHMMMQDEARDHSIMLPMLHYFVSRMIERSEYDFIRDALEAVYDDTGIDWDDIAEAVDRMGICDPDFCKREYNVGVTVPVTITVSVLATSHDRAEEEAQNEIDSNGLDNYQMDYDLWSAEYYVEEQ